MSILRITPIRHVVNYLCSVILLLTLVTITESFKERSRGHHGNLILAYLQVFHYQGIQGWVSRTSTKLLIST